MKIRILYKEECAQSDLLLKDLTATLVASSDKLEVANIGIILTALSSLLLGAIASSFPKEDWKKTIDTIFLNIQQAAAEAANREHDASISGYFLN